MVTVMNEIVNRHQLRQKIGKRAVEQPKSPETEPNYKAICRQLTQKNSNSAKPTKLSRPSMMN